MSPLDFLTWAGLIALVVIVYAAIVLIFIGVLQSINNQGTAPAAPEPAEDDAEPVEPPPYYDTPTEPAPKASPL